VDAYRLKAPTRKFQRLKMLLASIPAWPPSSYEGYNFITDAKGPQASEIAVYGKKMGIPGGDILYQRRDQKWRRWSKRLSHRLAE
jgi:hypothetical protein